MMCNMVDNYYRKYSSARGLRVGAGHRAPLEINWFLRVSTIRYLLYFSKTASGTMRRWNTGWMVDGGGGTV